MLSQSGNYIGAKRPDVSNLCVSVENDRRMADKRMISWAESDGLIFVVAQRSNANYDANVRSWIGLSDHDPEMRSNAGSGSGNQKSVASAH